MFFPCLCSSLCQQQQWDLGLGCVRLPLILLAIIHGHLSLFTYSCKPKDDNPSGDSEDYSDHFFFSMEQRRSHELRFIYSFRRCFWHFYRSTPAIEICFFNTSSHMHHEADAVYSFMPCAELINPVNFFLRAAFGIKRGCLNIGTPSWMSLPLDHRRYVISLKHHNTG